MHWKLEAIYQFMDCLITSRKFEFILLINCCNRTQDETDINEHGTWRPLSGLYLPLNKYKPTTLTKYNDKEILLTP